MIVPFHKSGVGEQELRAADEAIRSGWLTMRPKTLECERILGALSWLTEELV